MKKISIIFSILVAFTIAAVALLSSGANANTLYLLNWGEYINDDLVSLFEKEYKCIVIEETVTSSETMYQKITSGTTSYDVAIPGDYMITKLQNEGYLYKLDVNNKEYKYLSQYQNMFVDSLQNLREKEMPNSMEYTMPYFWGAYSMIYNTQYADTESVVLNNGFKALFDKTLYENDVKIGMYSTARWCVSSYLMGQGMDPNLEDLDEDLIATAIKNASFDVWGDDQLKRKTATGDLDLCYTQLGDFFDALWLSLEEGMDINDSGLTGLDALGFNVSVPKTTAAFFDGMIIPTTSKNQKLANQFIDFMLNPLNAYENALAIGYCPTLKSVIDMYEESALAGELYFEDEENPSRNITMEQFLNKYPVYLNPLLNCDDFDAVTMLSPKEADYMTLCEKIVNQAKSSTESGNNLGTVICICVGSATVVGISAYITYKVIKKKKRKKVING